MSPFKHAELLIVMLFNHLERRCQACHKVALTDMPVRESIYPFPKPLASTLSYHDQALSTHETSTVLDLLT